MGSEPDTGEGSLFGEDGVCIKLKQRVNRGSQYYNEFNENYHGHLERELWGVAERKSLGDRAPFSPILPFRHVRVDLSCIL